jgi:hypothetical protein
MNCYFQTASLRKIPKIGGKMYKNGEIQTYNLIEFIFLIGDFLKILA